MKSVTPVLRRHNTFSYFTLLMQDHHAFELFVTTNFDILLLFFFVRNGFLLHLFPLFCCFTSCSVEIVKDDNKL